MLADEVLLGRLVQRGDQPHGLVEQRDQVREGVAEEAADAADDIDPRPAQLGQRDDLDAEEAAVLLLPAGRTPSSASTSAMSSPWVRIALVPQMLMPTVSG